MQRAHDILKSVFGYDAFRHHQAEIINTLMAGGDALVLMPTGGGKSICYQIPSLVREGTGIVISPLIALMQDQVDALSQLGMRAAFLNSTLDAAAQRAVERQLLAGELDLLYLAPERLLNPATLALLARVNIALFAIDEAHCVSQWGHDFRREYQQLSMLHTRFPMVPRIALTATADPRTRAEIIAQLALEDAAVFVNSFDRPNIHYVIHEGGGGREALWRFIAGQHPRDAGIVYCQTRKGVEQLAEWLGKKGRVALAYHAGLDQGLRRHHQQRFLAEEGVIVVATIAFGMGIDKPDVRFVAHMNLPKSIESYYQETGRAGRDGLAADAWMSYGLQDVVGLRMFTDNSDADEAFKRIMRGKTDAMLGLCELTECRRVALLAYFGEAMNEPCGNCDNCLDPPVTWDATIAAQKALSCVYRTGQRFGAQYVIDVLSGKEDARITANGHDRLSTFGIGSEHTAIAWRGIFRQLVAHGLLTSDAEGYGVLRLTPKAWPLLKRGETPAPVMLRALRQTEPRAKVKGAAATLDGDRPLFDALRSLRTALAKEQGVPPYVIFPDKTLSAMAAARPADTDALLDIPGVGTAKCERYGPAFLQAIRDGLDAGTVP
jgi:ATP-dependent DNA helicase RecQ